MASSALPRGVYATYKRATRCFLDWLSRAGAAAGLGARSGAPLEALDRVVRRVTSEPTRLSPALLQSLPRALEACACAITLRERVAAYLAEAADEAHAHFLRQLKQWLAALETVSPKRAERAQDAATTRKPTLDFHNYYEVLALPEDYFGDEDEVDEEPGGGTTTTTTMPPTLTPAERKRLFDEAFAEDLNAELACLLMELDELAEGVYAAFHDIKHETKTLVEATVVAKVAIDCAESVIAKLQLRYPSIRSGTDLVGLIRDRLTLVEMERLVARVTDAWTHEEEGDDDNLKYRYVPGTVLVGMLWVTPHVAAFGKHIRAGPGRRFQSSAELHGERYSEADNPIYSMPVVEAGMSFISQQLPAFHQLMIELIEKDFLRSEELGLVWFWEPFEKFSVTGEVSIHLLFVCICWFRSVAALEGNRGLGRAVSLSITHRWDLIDRLKASIANANEHLIDPETLRKWTKAVDDMQLADGMSGLMRFNPLLAGCFLLQDQFKYLVLGHDTMLMTSRLTAFCHIYSALRDRLLLDEIPFVKRTIEVYESALFGHSRAAPTHGSFTQSYLTLQKQVLGSVDASFNRQMSGTPEMGTPVWERVRFHHFTRLLKVVFEKDYSVLQSQRSTVSSWKNLLLGVSDLASEELFGTQVLSRDFLKLNDDLTDLFFSLRDELYRRPQFEKLLEKPALSPTQAVNRALECSVLFPLLPMLDALNHDGSTRPGIDVTVIDEFKRRKMRQSTATRPRDVVLAFCRHAATVIARHFGNVSEIERRYYSFPPTPAWASLEFGAPHITSQETALGSFIRSADMTATFRSDAKSLNALMDMMKSSRGPLTADQLTELKRVVIANPSILGLASMDPIELTTLFHQAAAGPAHDLRLVEWLIQMGALEMESPHCRFAEEMMTMARQDALDNALAIHCAAEQGLTNIVLLILEAGNLRDLDTATFRTKESLVHIAVKTGNEELFDWLIAHGADMSKTDAAGNNVWDLTANRLFKSRIRELANHQKQQTAKLEVHAARGRKLPHSAELDQLRKALRLQRDAERVAASNEKGATSQTLSASGGVLGGNSSMNAIESKKKNKNKKKKKKKTKKKTITSTAIENNPQLIQEAQDVIGATDMMRRLMTSDSSDATKVKVTQLALALEKLRHGAATSEEVQEASAARAIDLLGEIEAIVDGVTTVQSLMTRENVRTELLDAMRALFLIDEYHRQLPEPRTIPNTTQTPLTNVEKMILRAGPNDDKLFTPFYLFGSKLAIHLFAYDLKRQSEDVMRLLEGRLLQITKRTEAFRAMVMTHAEIRRMMKVTPTLAVTTEALRHFEWYEDYHGVDDDETLDRLDRLYGCNFYLRLRVVGGFAAPGFTHCMHIIDAITSN